MGKPLKIVLLGAHRRTGNLGVSALAEGTLAGIFEYAPEARVTMFVDAREPGEFIFRHAGREHVVSQVGISYSRNVFRPNHILPLLAKALLLRMIGRGGLGRRVAKRGGPLGVLYEADMAADISGGDSFSDRYGLYRMLLQSLMKTFVLASGTDLVLLPQTIGPFEAQLSKAAAGAILRRASAIYCRDRESLERVRRLAGPRRVGRLGFACDVSFLVEAERPENCAAVEWAAARGREGVLVGLNVSGLLASGGYTRRNQFGLKSDYLSTISKLADALLSEQAVSVLFVPHVYGRAGGVENDVDACRRIVAGLPRAARERTFVAEGEYTPAQVKYLTGLCAVFAGSRMHACLAALSQGVPAAAMAYSAKFLGVFESLGIADLTVDLRERDQDEVVEHVLGVLRDRERIRVKLVGEVRKAGESAKAAFRETLGATRGEE